MSRASARERKLTTAQRNALEIFDGATRPGSEGLQRWQVYPVQQSTINALIARGYLSEQWPVRFAITEAGVKALRRRDASGG